MGYTGIAAAGKTYIGTGSTSPTFASIGTSSGLSGLILGNGDSEFTAVTLGNDGILITSNTGVPSILANGTTGQVLTATTSNPPTWMNPATSGTVTSVSGTDFQVAVATGTTTPVISLIGPYTPATYTAHGILIGEGTSSITTVGPTSTAGQILQSAGASNDPVFSTATYPSTSGTSGNVLTSDGTNFVSTAPGGTSVITWSDKAASFNADAGNGYFITAAATATLPASPTQGQTIAFTADSAIPSVITIQANTGQFIRFSTSISASAGTAVNVARGDSITLVYRAADTTWIAQDFVGNWTIT